MLLANLDRQLQLSLLTEIGKITSLFWQRSAGSLLLFAYKVGKILLAALRLPGVFLPRCSLFRPDICYIQICLNYGFLPGWAFALGDVFALQWARCNLLGPLLLSGANRSFAIACIAPWVFLPGALQLAVALFPFAVFL